MLSDSPRGSGFEHSSFFSARMVKELMQPLGGKSADRGQVVGLGVSAEIGFFASQAKGQNLHFALTTFSVTPAAQLAPPEAEDQPNGLITSFLLRRRRGAQDVGMARELRLEFPGACYHVINRGNYRHHVFGPAGAQIAFETCLSRPARSRVGCCTRLWSWATTTTSQWKRGRPILRSPVPFLIQNQPTLPVGRQLRPTDSSRISQSRFLGGV